MNFCYVNPDGGPVTVKITVDNGARSNWNCAHASKEDDNNWKAIESFKLNSGDDGTSEHALTADIKTFDETSLLWKVTACASIPGVEKAKFLLAIFQDDVELFEKKSERQVPQCQQNKAIQFKSMVAFKFHSDQDENVDIWDVLS